MLGGIEMSMSIGGIGRMMLMKCMHGMEFMRGHRMGFMCGMEKPDASEIADRIFSHRDKDGDGALSADELGRLSDRLGLVEEDFNSDGLIDKEKLIAKITEKLEKMGKPDASEIADRIFSHRDKDGDGALSADELGRLSDRLGLVEEDFNSDGLIDKEKLIAKISEKLENMEKSPKMRDLNLHRICMIKQMAAQMGQESTDTVSETPSSSDLVKQLLSQLNLSEEETASFLETMKHYGINVTA
jgi:hypothetical protein